MGDSEPMVAETSAAESYPLDGYNNTSSNPVPEAGATAVAEIPGEAAALANSSYEFPYSGDGDPNSGLQQAQFSAADGAKQTVAVPDANEASGVVGMDATESGVVSGDHSSVNGGVDTTGLENGNAPENVDGSSVEKQLTDAYGMYI